MPTGGRLGGVLRQLLAVVLVVGLAGCAVRPPEPTSAPTLASPASSARTTLQVGDDGSAEGHVLAEVYVRALAAKGIAAEHRPVSGGLAATVPELTRGRVAVLPVFARTAANELGVGELPPGSDEIVGAVARALDGEAAVLQPSAVTHEPIYAMTQAGASRAKATSLADLAKLTDLALALPASLAKAPDGPDGLAAAYGLAPELRTVDDPAERLRALQNGHVQVAAFRPTEEAAATLDLVVLGDPDVLIQPDPHVALLSPALAENPDVVACLQAVHQALGNADVARLAAADPDALSAAVTGWLQTKGLA